MDDSEICRIVDDQGFCILPSVLDTAGLKTVREALDDACRQMADQGIDGFDSRMDPNPSNIRVNNLPEFSALFVDLLRYPGIFGLMRRLLGPDGYVSNFTANIAMPGSGSMRIHSDQALVVPSPWLERWALNMIWCLDDTHEANGATRYLPGSHRFHRREDLPADPIAHTRPFEAPAGSVIVMDGRLWHTSGKNVTETERRAMLFAYYTRGFVRGQVNWDVCLSETAKTRLDKDARALLGMGPYSNVAQAYDLVMLQ